MIEPLLRAKHHHTQRPRITGPRLGDLTLDNRRLRDTITAQRKELFRLNARIKHLTAVIARMLYQ